MTAIAGIEVGCSTNLLNNPAEIVECVAALPLELATVELELEEGTRVTLAKSDAASRQRLAAALLELAERQGRRYLVHAPWFGRELSLCSPGFPELARTALLLALDFAERIGSPIVTFHPGVHEKQTEAMLIENLLANLDPIVRVAENAGITLCMEIMGGERSKNAQLSNAAHARVWEELGVRACLDVPHAASRVATASDLKRYIDEMLGWLGHVHLADTEFGVHRHLPIGMGKLDLVGLLHHLAGGGYRGSAVVEEWNRGHSPQVYLECAVRFATERRN